MKKCMLVVAALSASFVVLADTPAKKSDRPRRAGRIALAGGRIFRPAALQGQFAIVNAQKSVPQSALDEARNYLKGEIDANFVTLSSDPVDPAKVGARMRELKANAAVFVVECKECETSVLVAPEQNWAIVNVSVLGKNCPNAKFLEVRTKKEILRAAMMACGGFGSQYPGALTNAMSKPEDLDEIVSVELPNDVLLRAVSALPKIGVGCPIKTTYREACFEGWAPAPTNEFQKAIWDEVHALPTKPLVIEPESKKQGK